MTKRSEFLHDLRNKTREIRNDVQKNFYFLEIEDLRRRPAKGKWSIVEVFAHINLTQGYYIKNIKRGLEEADEVNHDAVKLSWLGKKLIEGMEPKDGVIRWKVKTFKKIDPVYRKEKKGIALDEKVIFQDFIDDMEELEDLMIASYDLDISSVKVPTFFPFLKINVADALAFDIAHIERHILQARRVLGEEEEE